MNMNAELGADRITVIPQPRYMPFRPCCFQRRAPSCMNVVRGAVDEVEAVCMRDLMVSAGKKRKL